MALFVSIAVYDIRRIKMDEKSCPTPGRAAGPAQGYEGFSGYEHPLRLMMTLAL